MRRALLIALLVLLAAAPPAGANGDPASDVLLGQDHFLPYAPRVQPRLEDALKAVLEDARDAGYPVKVALVQSPADLGAYPELFNQPQAYADLLKRELAALNPHGDPVKSVHLLTVMPVGFGGNDLGDGVDEALQAIDVQEEAQSDGLAVAAMAAVARLATANGHPVTAPPEARLDLAASDASSERGGTSPLLFALPAIVLFAALAVANRVSRRRGA